MTSEELADEIEYQINRNRERILGIGQEQYAQEEDQLFETMPLAKLFEYTYEELDDIVAYAVMTRIRFRRLEAAIMNRIADEYKGEQ